MATVHVFNVALAEKYGAIESIILSNVCWWVETNKKNERNYINGRYWTYLSMTGMQEIFSYLSKSQIRNTIEKLRREKALLTGNFNKRGYDRTLWYTVSDEVMRMYNARAGKSKTAAADVPDGDFDEPDSAHQTDQTGNKEEKNRVKKTHSDDKNDGVNIPNGNFDVLNSAYQTDQMVTLGDTEEKTVFYDEKNGKKEGKRGKNSEKSTHLDTETEPYVPDLPNGNFDMLNPTNQTDQMVTLGDTEEKTVSFYEINGTQEGTCGKNSEKSTHFTHTDPETDTNVPNGNFDVPDPAHQTDETVTLMCEISQMDVLNSADPCAEFSTPIPANKPVNKQAAAADQKSRFAAFVENLKKYFSTIDETLVFDTSFYPKAAAYLIKHKVKKEYPKWLFSECKEKNPKNLRYLYHKLFFEPDMLSLFQVWCTREEGSKNGKGPVIVCPACGEAYAEQAEECPRCRLSKSDIQNEKEVARQKKILAMPQEERERYREETARAYFENRDNPEKANEQWREVQKKYHLLD